MLSNFIYAKTKALFIKELNANNVPEEAIVFIEDTGEIWNHGMYFSKSQVHIGSEAPEDDSNIKIWLIPDGETESDDPIIIIDSQLSTISTNPVENQAITKALNSKQDNLVSGVNIKKINGVDILGEGEVTIQTGTDITVDSQMDDSSTNPVQNRIVKEYIDDNYNELVSYTDEKASTAETNSKAYTDELVGDIKTLLIEINGEEV